MCSAETTGQPRGFCQLECVWTQRGGSDQKPSGAPCPGRNAVALSTHLGGICLHPHHGVFHLNVASYKARQRVSLRVRPTRFLHVAVVTALQPPELHNIRSTPKNRRCGWLLQPCCHHISAREYTCVWCCAKTTGQPRGFHRCGPANSPWWHLSLPAAAGSPSQCLPSGCRTAAYKACQRVGLSVSLLGYCM